MTAVSCLSARTLTAVYRDSGDIIQNAFPRFLVWEYFVRALLDIDHLTHRPLPTCQAMASWRTPSNHVVQPSGTTITGFLLSAQPVPADGGGGGGRVTPATSAVLQNGSANWQAVTIGVQQSARVRPIASLSHVFPPLGQ